MLRAGMFGIRRASLLLGVTLLGAASGCVAEVRSCDLKTDEIVMWATLTDSDAGVEVEIEFAVGDSEGAAIALCPERDRLEVNGTEATVIRALGLLFYTVKFEEPQGSYEIVLARNGGQSVTTLVEPPPAFEIVEPALDSTHPRSAPLTVSWTPEWSGGMVDLAVEDAIGSDCIEGLGVYYQLEDTGSFIIGGNSLVSGRADPENSLGCAVTVSLSRSASVDYPAAFHEGGSISAYVRRRRPFTSVE